VAANKHLHLVGHSIKYFASGNAVKIKTISTAVHGQYPELKDEENGRR
jgi:hypothetical protein